MSPVIDENPGTELIAAEIAPVGDEVSRDTDDIVPTNMGVLSD